MYNNFLKTQNLNVNDSLNQFNLLLQEAKQINEYEKRKFTLQKRLNNQKYFNNKNKKNLDSIISPKNLTKTYNPENFNILKVVSEIKKRAREIKKEDSFQQALSQSHIAFNKENVDLVFDSTKLLNEMKLRKKNKLYEDKSPISKFINENKKISVDNVLIKLLNEESDKLVKKEINYNESIKNRNLNFNVDEKVFNEYLRVQKDSFRKIEDLLEDVQKKNRVLLKEKFEYNGDNKMYEDEIEKILFQLENFRICAKFVCKVLLPPNYTEKINDMFSLQILNEDIRGRKDLDFPELIHNTIRHYNFVNDNNSEFNIEMKELLKEPNNMIIKFKEIEDKILKLLEENRKITDSIIIQQIEDEKILTELKNRELLHKEEYDYVQEQYEKEIEELKKLDPKNIECYLDLFTVINGIKDINKTLNEFENGKVKKNIHIFDAMKECNSITKKIENKVNLLLDELDKYEKEDPNTFYEITVARKSRNKENKYYEVKQKMEQELQEKRKKASKRFEKIIIISRKTEIPYYKKKKPKKEIKKNLKNIEEENNNLLNY
jgi:hypothetical protein